MIAWLRDSTLQSNIQLFGAGLLLATERPTLDASVNNTFLSSKGWELGRDVRIAIAIFHYNHVEPIQNDGPPPMVTLRMLTQRIAGIWHVTKWTTPPPHRGNSWSYTIDLNEANQYKSFLIPYISYPIILFQPIYMKPIFALAHMLEQEYGWSGWRMSEAFDIFNGK